VEAVDVALESRNFALALLVSSFCDADTYHNAVTQFAEKVLLPSSPLHTIAMLFSGQLGSSIWSADSKELLGSWRCHLAAIISNRTQGWERIVFTLGTKLQQLGNVHAAHVCFMVCGLQIMSPILPETYVSLLGCDHLLPENVSLMTEEGLEAYERTEAYEWAKRKGNPNAMIKTLQPYKLQYAMILADFGFVKLAETYLENILVMCDLAGDETRFENQVTARLTLPEMCASPAAFKAALASFEQRLFHKAVEKEIAAMPSTKSTPPFHSPPPAMDDPGISPTRSDSDVSFMTAISHVPDAATIETLNQPKKKDKVGSKIARVKRNPKKDTKAETLLKTDTKANKGMPVIDGTPAAGKAASSTSVANTEAPRPWPPSTQAVSGQSSEMKTQPVNNPAKAPADSKEKPMSTGKPESTGKKKVDPSPRSAPAVMIRSKLMAYVCESSRMLISATSRFSDTRVVFHFAERDWTFGMAQKMTEWLNPEATTADLGEGMQAYYDEDKKVWVFPGEDPAEKAKPLPPPPTPMDMTSKQEVKPEPDMATDPLAAMMAPPKRAPASYGRSHGVPATPRSLYPGMAPPMPGMGPTGFNAPGSAAPGSGAPPQFMVFKPPSPQLDKQPEDTPKSNEEEKADN
jgi:Sec23-binding domain of Sec16